MRFKFLILLVLLSLISCKTKVVESEQTESSEKTEAPEFIGKQIEQFAFPLPNEYRQNISSLQGLRAGNGIYSTNYHNAVDFAVPVRTKVFAAKSGVVANCYPSYDNGSIWKGHPVYGGMIELRHNDGTRSLYAHLIRTDVREGEWVEKGQIIGATGGKKDLRGSGVSTGPHLHFAIYVDVLDMLD